VERVVQRRLESPAPDDGHQFGIGHPKDPGRIIAVVLVHTGAVATSGTAHRVQHLLDARTGRACSGIASATVVAQLLTWADIDATAGYAQGRDAAHWLATRPGRTGFIVWEDGTSTTVPPRRGTDI